MGSTFKEANYFKGGPEDGGFEINEGEREKFILIEQYYMCIETDNGVQSLEAKAVYGRYSRNRYGFIGYDFEPHVKAELAEWEAQKHA